MYLQILAPAKTRSQNCSQCPTSTFWDSRQGRYQGIITFNFIIFTLFENFKAVYNFQKVLFFFLVALLWVSARQISGFMIFGSLSLNANFKEYGLQFSYFFLHPGWWTKLRYFKHVPNIYNDHVLSHSGIPEDAEELIAYKRSLSTM